MTQPEERFLAVPCRGYRVGSQAVLLTSSVWEGVRRVTPVEAAVLRLGSGERTLDDHAAVVARSSNSDSPVEVRQVLVELADAGLLRSSADRLRSSETSAARNHARITTLGIATADRPRQLERCLDSYRELLPPFLPAGRNEDGVFGATMGLCAPEAFFGHLAYGVIHDSDRLAPSGRSTILSASQSRVSEVLVALVRRYPASVSRTIQDRMRHLGVYLSDVANADVDQLMRLVTEASLNVHGQHLMMAERSAGADPGQATVERYREVFIGNVANPNFFVPVEFQGSASAPDARSSVQSFLSDYSRLLNAWPDLWEQGKQLAHNSTG